VNILSAVAALFIIKSLGLWGTFVKNVIPSEVWVTPKKIPSFIEIPHLSGP